MWATYILMLKELTMPRKIRLLGITRAVVVMHPRRRMGYKMGTR
jgi:hypothetical protein